MAQGSGHVIENLSDDFAARLNELNSKVKVAFAHDALSYDPIAKQLDEPLGSLDARAAAVPEGEAFAKWKAQLVKSQAHPKAPYPITAASPELKSQT